MIPAVAPGGEESAVGSAPLDAALARAGHRVGERSTGEDAAAPILDHSFGGKIGRNGDGGGDVAVAVFGQREGGDAIGFGRHRPSATMRSMAPRARTAMSSGTVM